MNTYAKKIVSLGALALSVTLSGIATVLANGETRPPFETLLSPTSYEQYLPLSAPSDVAVNDDFTAIADGSFIYVYNRAKDEYTRYEHTTNTATEKNAVSKLQFGSDGNLYFLDASTYLYFLTPETLVSDAPQPQATNFTCSTFTLQGNDVYFTNVSKTAQLSKTTLAALNVSEATTLVQNLGSNPAIAYADGFIYYTHNGVTLNRVSADVAEPVTQHARVCTVNDDITSMTVYADEVCFTDNVGNFFAYNLTALDYADQPTDEALHLADKAGGYKAVSRHGNFVYAIKDQSVRQYDGQTAGFTNFEISANSSATHRLRGATDSALCKQLLVTADTGNQRISVYSTADATYRVFPTDQPYDKVATDGENAVVATAEKVAIYRLSDGEQLFSWTNFNGNLAGVAAVYGKYYFVTDTNYFYSITWQPYDTGAVVGAPQSGYAYYPAFVQKTDGLAPELLASDVYGNLYVAASNNEVHRYDETAFMDAENHGEDYFQIEDGCAKLLVDLEERLYAVNGNTVHVYQKDVAVKAVDLSASLVYSQTTGTPVTTVAFSAEEPFAYVIYDGNLTVQTTELNLFPNMQQIESYQIDETLFSENQAECSVVKTAQNALLIAFNLENTKGEQYFPYLSYLRSETELTGLKIGETHGYDLVAVYDTKTQTYTTYLTRPAFVTVVETVTPYDEENQTVGYVTNAVRLYKFPYLTDLLTFADIPKNAQVKLVGEMNELDYEYYYVAYQDGETTKYGYLPKAYVTPFNGAPPETTTETYGDAEACQDSVWRMTYILLGIAAILVLTDYLILRPKKED